MSKRIKDENDALIGALAECRDAMPETVAVRVNDAIADPLAVPGYVLASVTHLRAQRDHFMALAQDNGQVIIKTACELADVKAQRDELLAIVEWAAEYTKHTPEQLTELRKWGELARATIAKHQPPAAPAAQGEPS